MKYIVLGWVNAADMPEVVEGQYVWDSWEKALDALVRYGANHENTGYFSFYRIGRVEIYPPVTEETEEYKS